MKTVSLTDIEIRMLKKALFMTQNIATGDSSLVDDQSYFIELESKLNRA